MPNSKPSDIKIDRSLGGWTISCPFPAVSLQADSDRRHELQQKIKDVTSLESFVFVGSIEIDISCFFTPAFFYEHDHRPDLDNVVKPILDALSKQGGILIDDTQVERVQSTFELDEDAGSGWFSVVVSFHHSDWVKRDHKFISIDKLRCTPYLERWKQFRMARAFSKVGDSYARDLFRIGRPWLKSDVIAAGFQVISQ